MPESADATPAIRCRSLTKRFIHRRRGGQPLYREAARLWGDTRADPLDTYAVKELDLELNGPHAFALVGPNGAGKSTLLRLIAGIYQPDGGQVETSGRVTCFFGQSGAAPTLSVIDNIHIQGAINGLSHMETRDGLDRVLAFAELEQHAESRVEHLSFGMQQRLFFAVTLETMRRGKAEIYLFDEWMAGADARFKEKAENAITDLHDMPKLVVYASHDLQRLRRMCDEFVYLRGGRLRLRGSEESVIDRYLAECGGRE